jgi:GNAT superfamily N-acetyltransferase
MVQVRSGRPEDAPHIAGFQVAMARETEDLALDPEVVAAGVQAVFDDPSKGAYWVAEEGGELVGCLLTVPEWSDWRNGQVLWIHSVYVAPAARGKGVYRSLYESLRGMVQEDPSLRGLRLYVDKRNLAAAEVYERLGMTREHYHLYEWLEE